MGTAGRPFFFLQKTYKWKTHIFWMKSLRFAPEIFRNPPTPSWSFESPGRTQHWCRSHGGGIPSTWTPSPLLFVLWRSLLQSDVVGGVGLRLPNHVLIWQVTGGRMLMLLFFLGKIMLQSGEKMIKDMAFLFLADSWFHHGSVGGLVTWKSFSWTNFLLNRNRINRDGWWYLGPLIQLHPTRIFQELVEVNGKRSPASKVNEDVNSTWCYTWKSQVARWQGGRWSYPQSSNPKLWDFSQFHIREIEASSRDKLQKHWVTLLGTPQQPPMSQFSGVRCLKHLRAEKPEPQAEPLGH